MAEQQVVATGLCFPEGPVALRDGSIVLVEIERQTEGHGTSPQATTWGTATKKSVRCDVYSSNPDGERNQKE